MIAQLAISQAKAGSLDQPQDASHLCGAAVQATEARYALPNGLLMAISEVESGRSVDGGAGQRPWPWTVQAENQGHFFATKAAAISWVQQAQARGVTSIDVGCLQVNLMYHPAAFRSLEDAFDPSRNADYAARFLISLHAATGDWRAAAGQYHSQTLALAIPYRERVEAMLGGAGALPLLADNRLQALQTAWNATMDSAASGAKPDTLTGNWSGLQPTPQPDRALHVRPRRIRPIMLSDAH